MIKWSKRPTIPVMTRRREPLRKCYSESKKYSKFFKSKRMSRMSLTKLSPNPVH